MAANFLEVEEVERTVKVIVVGNGSVGKTSLIRRFVDGVFDENYKQTIGTIFKEKRLYIKHKDEHIVLHLWDTAGQEKFDSLTRRYYRGASFCILVFSTTDRHSFLCVEKWYNKVIDECCGGRRDSRDICIVLVQNKIDMIAESKINPDEAEQLARKLGIKFFRICVKNNFYVEEVFKDITKYYIKYSRRLKGGGSSASGGKIDPIYSLFNDNDDDDLSDDDDDDDLIDSFNLDDDEEEEEGEEEEEDVIHQNPVESGSSEVVIISPNKKERKTRNQKRENNVGKEREEESFIDDKFPNQIIQFVNNNNDEEIISQRKKKKKNISQEKKKRIQKKKKEEEEDDLPQKKVKNNFFKNNPNPKISNKKKKKKKIEKKKRMVFEIENDPEVFNLKKSGKNSSDYEVNEPIKRRTGGKKKLVHQACKYT